jgi:hypothetical protein
MSFRRRSLLACLGACCLGARPSRASGLLCDFAGFGAGGAPPLVGPGSGRAVAEVKAVQAAIGYAAPLAVFQAGGGNAFAMLGPNGTKLIGYNAGFLSQLDRIGGRFAPISVLAHEVGHHANGDTSWQAAARHPWMRELGADWVSGYALARLNASAEEATRALRAMFNHGSATHPDTPRRIHAVLAGWQQGGGGGALRFG